MVVVVRSYLGFSSNATSAASFCRPLRIKYPYSYNFHLCFMHNGKINIYIYVNKGQNENEPSVWEQYFIVNCIDSVVLFPVWLLLYHRLSDCIWVWVSNKIVSKVVSSQHSSRWLHSFPLFLLFLSQDVLVASGFTVEESSAAQDRTLHPCHLLLSGNDACLYVRTLVVLYLSYLVKKKKKFLRLDIIKSSTLVWASKDSLFTEVLLALPTKR